MWHLKMTTVSVVDGALVIIKKRADELGNKIPVSPSSYEIQKIALCGTAHLLRRLV